MTLRGTVAVLLMVSGLLIVETGEAQHQRTGRETVESRDEPGQVVVGTQTFDRRNPVLDREIDGDEYVMGPGDVLAVSILSVQNKNFMIEVSPAGELLIPAFGVVNTREKTLNAVRGEIKSLVGSRLQGSEVHTTLIYIREYQVFVYGAIPEPGFHKVYATDRLQNLIDRTSLRQLALTQNITITRADGSVIPADLLDYRYGGNTDANPKLEPGDRVYIPFGTFDRHTVLVYGAVVHPGHRVIRENETLRDLMLRTVEVRQQANLDRIILRRLVEDGHENIELTLNDLDDVIIQPRDEVIFLSQRSVSVHGYVGDPGSFGFIPEFTAADYVTLAGGLKPVGTMKNVKITRLDGTVLFGESVLIERGDVVEVNKSLRGYLLGDVSVLSILATTASVAITAYAITRQR